MQFELQKILINILVFMILYFYSVTDVDILFKNCVIRYIGTLPLVNGKCNFVKFSAIVRYIVVVQTE